MIADVLPADQKARGAYYTDPIVASFLVRWAARTANDRILEPCFGGAVFLRAAIERVASLGGDPRANVVGVEVDPAVHQVVKKYYGNELGTDALLLSDFFALESNRIGGFSCVVGNPPFIRYQRFNGDQRALALVRASRAGADLSALTSAWAPFLVHAATFLRPGGRLAMVAPAELCHASYARPVLRFLRDRFGLVRVLTFEKKLFPDISEDTVLVLGEHYGHSGGDVRLVPLRDANALKDDPFEVAGIPISWSPQHEVTRLVLYLLPEATRDLYRNVCRRPGVLRTTDVATVGIGYVTGNNGFFHLAASEARDAKIPHVIQSPAVCRAAWLRGLSFTEKDWRKLDAEGLKTRLLKLSPAYRPDKGSAVAKYLASGVRRKINRAYKCRVREPWYAVPHVSVPDLFLTYMANQRPALVVNEARAVAPNTLLCVRLKDRDRFSPEALAAGWWTSLAALSAEIEGHGLGGGMLKLEPGEAANIPFPLPAQLRDRRVARRLMAELDLLVRRGATEAALDLGDREILQSGLGLSEAECKELRGAFHFLKNRRCRR